MPKKLELNDLSEWLNHHKFLLTVTAAMLGWSFSYFAPADELNILKKEFVQYRFEDITHRELESTRRQLDNLKKIPENDRPQWVIDSIERLKRQEQRLEDKISSINS